ncbi:MAG: PD-(D/E)XK nuclease family protein [Wolbachia endosymbiont of Fragariocoptes setiger]|nr:PD-(D/E)XK nuclease family protein [Wolbachia endosymbiont of Fragariocoptes setiger]
MGEVLCITTNEYFFDVLAEYILLTYGKRTIQNLKIILPSKIDSIELLNAFKKCNVTECFILPEIISLENIDEEDLILSLDKIEVIHPVKRILLLIQFILKWNQDNNDNFPIDLSYSLVSSLDTIQENNELNYYSNKTIKFISLLLNTWSNTLKDLGVIDILEHKNNYINNMILSLQNDQNIIFIGTDKKNKIYRSLIKAIYKLPNSRIILPNLNLIIEERDWQLFEKKHYQYCLKSLLDDLNINRSQIRSLNDTSCNIMHYIFDTTFDLREVKSNQNHIEIITCESVEEEAQVISLIIQNEGYENVSLFVNNKLLETRISSLIKDDDTESYLYTTLLTYSIDLLISNWNSIELLSLLKHNLVTFNYTKEEYNKIISEFEIEILRNFNISDLKNTIIKNNKIQYTKDILYIIRNLETALSFLVNAVDDTIYKMAVAHKQCIDMLSQHNQKNSFISNFTYACKNINIRCSLELYRKILSLFLETPQKNSFSLYKNKVVIIADFTTTPNFQNPFLSSIIQNFQEDQGYFLYTLCNLFCARKVYLTSSSNKKKSLILKRIEILFPNKQPYREWLKMLNKPECITPCSQPQPKPSTTVRKQKMQRISCTKIEKLIRSPYSFYAEYILELKKLRELNPKAGILEFGTLVHNILEKYVRYNDDECINIARREFFSSNYTFSSMWWIRLKKIINSFVEIEKGRSLNVEVEKSFILPILKETLLTVKCDRIEHLPNNQVAIIDYKFGSPPSSDEVISGFFPQLILQALVVECITKKEVTELAYWKFDYDQIKITSLKDYKETIIEFQNTLPIFLFDYLNENTPFTASPYLNKFLRFNGYTHLERIKEW